MLVKYHIIIGLIISGLIWFIFPNIGWFYVLVIFLSSFLIDFDHYLWYAFKKKDWNLINAYNWMMKKRDFFKGMLISERYKYKTMIMIFHGIECWILILLLIFIHKIFLFILIGVAIHMILDFIDLIYNKHPLYLKTSQICVHIKNKKKKPLV